MFRFDDPEPPRKITRPDQEPIAPLRAEDEEPEHVKQKESTSTLDYLIGKVTLKGGQPGGSTKFTKPRRQAMPGPERFPPRPPGPPPKSR